MAANYSRAKRVQRFLTIYRVGRTGSKRRKEESCGIHGGPGFWFGWTNLTGIRRYSRKARKIGNADAEAGVISIRDCVSTRENDFPALDAGIFPDCQSTATMCLVKK